MSEMEDLERAREIFRHYDGSRFHMDRDGASEEYRRFAVPHEIEQRWLAELTASHLSQLASPDGWRAVYFVNHHSDLSHLAEIITAQPTGVFWQRCSYEELLLEYLDRCGDGALSGPVSTPLRYNDAVIARALNRVTANGRALRRRVRSDHSVRRVEVLLEDASRRQEAAVASPVGFWRWSNLERTAVPAHP